MSKANVMFKISIMLGMFAAVLLMVLILPSFSASAAGPVTSITLDQTSIHLYTTQKIQLHATVLPTDATNTGVVWSSADTSIAAVNSNGTVTGVSFGQTTITATAADGSGVYATCECLVNPYYDAFYAPSLNQDARRVRFQFNTNSDISLVYIHIGSRIYYVNRPSAGTPYDQTVNGDHIKVAISYDLDTHAATWDCQISLTPTVEGTTETIYFEMFDGYCMAQSFPHGGFIFWDAKILSSITPGGTINNYIAPYLVQPGISYEVVDCVSFQTITFDDYTPLATGMLLLRKYNYGQYTAITRIEFVVIFGDVTGGVGIGDSGLDYNDANAILDYYNGTGGFSSYIFVLAADANHDGSVTPLDAYDVLGDYYGLGDVSQMYFYYYVAPVLYYQTTCVFS